MLVNSIEELIETLAQSLGDQQARVVVSREAAALSYGPALSPAEAMVLLGKIETLNGTAGLAARLVRVRLERAVTSEAKKPPTAPRETVPRETSPRETGPHQVTAAAPKSAPLVAVVELEALFAKSLGDAAAKDVVHRAVVQLGLTPVASGASATPSIRREDASRLLDLIEGSGGVAAAVASFAKARFLLRFR